MPAFGIGTNTNQLDSGEVRGDSYNIACKVWFPTNHAPYPLSFKFQGEDGLIQTISNINIHSTEDKMYSGIKSIEYRCDAVIGGFKKEFKLIFYMEDCRWRMVI